MKEIEEAWSKLFQAEIVLLDNRRTNLLQKLFLMFSVLCGCKINGQDILVLKIMHRNQQQNSTYEIWYSEQNYIAHRQ